jgi:hypothetical protein
MVDSLKESSTNVNELSSWFSGVEPLKFDKLRRNITVDVAIIGGGMLVYQRHITYQKQVKV